MRFCFVPLVLCLLFVVVEADSGFVTNKRPTGNDMMNTEMQALASVGISYLRTGNTDAVCIDGTSPAYHFSKGAEEGIHSWLIHLEGRQWCTNVSGCIEAMKSAQGSSNFMATTYEFNGVLSGDKRTNPKYYNWNRLVIRSCDGSSYTGDVELYVDRGTKLHLRGFKIFEAMLEHLFPKGSSTVINHAILSGCSSGGVASILHCDHFSKLLPHHSTVTCLADGGSLFDGGAGENTEALFHDMAVLHGSFKNFPPSYSSNKKKGSFLQSILEGVVVETIVVGVEKIIDYTQVQSYDQGLNDSYDMWNVSLGLDSRVFVLDTCVRGCQIEDLFKESMGKAIDIWSHGGHVREIDERHLTCLNKI